MKLFNSMGHKKQTFKPRTEGTAKVFTCGPSTYRRPHIGNYRSFLYEDVLVRSLEYSGLKVERVINFTDVEDKTIEEAGLKGSDIKRITDDVAEHFHRETAELDIKLPKVIPTAATSVDQAVHMVKALVEKGHAYWHDGDVFFDPLTYKSFGKLFGLDMSKWPKKKVRFKRDTYNGRRWNRGDFILWHGGEHAYGATWDTEIGKGRPSWNVQDPSMITKHLGNEIDIMCGGIDNIFRHHDYNIAVMETYSGKKFANFFLHGEHLVVEGRSMSKSLGNILYPEDVLKGKVTPKELRFFLLHTHYRKKLNFTFEKFENSRVVLHSFVSAAAKLISTAKSGGKTDCSDLIASITDAFEQHAFDDLAVGRGFDAVREILTKCSTIVGDDAMDVRDAAALKRNLEKMDTILKVIEPLPMPK